MAFQRNVQFVEYAFGETLLPHRYDRFQVVRQPAKMTPLLVEAVKALHAEKDDEIAMLMQAGMIHWRMRGKPEVAEKYFRKALKLGLNMDYDVAMAKLSLAGIAMQKRRKREATTLLSEAKKLDKNNMLTDQIRMMQQQMKRI